MQYVSAPARRRTAGGVIDWIGVDMADDICIVEGCSSPAFARRWCRKHYAHFWRRGLEPLPRPTTEERFWAKVERTSTCWLWTGSVVGNGYGKLLVDGREVGAHRYAYELLVGPIPPGLTIDHGESALRETDSARNLDCHTRTLGGPCPTSSTPRSGSASTHSRATRYWRNYWALRRLRSPRRAQKSRLRLRRWTTPGLDFGPFGCLSAWLSSSLGTSAPLSGFSPSKPHRAQGTFTC